MTDSWRAYVWWADVQCAHQDSHAYCVHHREAALCLWALNVQGDSALNIGACLAGS